MPVLRHQAGRCSTFPMGRGCDRTRDQYAQPTTMPTHMPRIQTACPGPCLRQMPCPKAYRFVSARKFICRWSRMEISGDRPDARFFVECGMLARERHVSVESASSDCDAALMPGEHRNR